MLVIFFFRVFQHILLDFITAHIHRIVSRPILHFLRERIEAFIPEINVKMFRFARSNAMITELHILRRISITIGCLEEISYSSAARFIVINLVALILIGSRCFNTVFHKTHRVIFGIDCNFGNIRFITRFVIGTIFLRRFVPIFCFTFHHFVQNTLLKIRINRLPLTIPIGQASILHIAIGKVGISVMMSFLCLHTGHCFLCLNSIFQHIKQIDNFHIFVGGFFQGIFDPAIRFTAHIDEQVAIRNFDDIICRRLVAVQVYTVVQQHGKFYILGMLSKDLSYPVIFRENRRDDLQRLVATLQCRRCRSGRRCGLPTAAQNTSSQ